MGIATSIEEFIEQKLPPVTQTTEPTTPWMTAKQLADYWQLHNSKAEPTTAGILKWAKRESNSLPHVYLGDLIRFHREEVDQWAREEAERRRFKVSLPAKRSGNIPSTYLALGSRIFSLARVNNMVNDNPFSHVSKLEEGGKRERYLTRVEATRLMAVLTGDLEHLRAPAIVSIGTGVRKSELLSLKVGEINFGLFPMFYRVSGRDLTIPPGCLLVAKSKNKESRTIPMNPQVEGTLKTVVANAEGHESVFTFRAMALVTALSKVALR
jgi:integrase